MITRSETITTSGSDGSATGTGKIGLGDAVAIEAIRVVYSGGQPATTDVTITDEDSVAILTLTDNNTTELYSVRRPASQPDGTDSTLTEVRSIASVVNVSVAGADDGETVSVEILF